MYLSESLHLYEVANYWRSIITMNTYQKQRFTKRIISCLFNNLAGKKIAVLGFAFKKDTSDTRESPAITLVSNFVAERAQVAIYDPQVKEHQIWKELVDDGGDIGHLTKNVTVCKTAYIACAGADAVVIVTEWDEFSNKTKVEASNAPSCPRTPKLMSTNHVLTGRSPTVMGGNFGLISPPVSPAKSDTENIHPKSVSLEKEPIECAETATTIPPPENIRLDWARIAQGMRKPMFVFDGRNILDADKLEDLGFKVEAIGRASTVSRDIHD